MHILGAYVHRYCRVRSFLYQNCGEDDCPEMTPMTMKTTTMPKHDGQFMITQALLAFAPNEPIIRLSINTVITDLTQFVLSV